ncbi:MAG: hypothetical protein H7289_07780 [Mucilaginibacter sp.]|nr:hypothetical protein [Mucilaginibacter sp.]
MDSILANIFLAVQQRLNSQLTDVKWIDQDLGQLEFYTTRPAVNFPCLLIEVDDTDYSDEGENSQIGEGIIQVRLGLTVYTDANNLTPTLYKEKAIDYYNLEHRVNKALHGWCDGRFFNPLMRRKSFKEKRDDNIRVRVLRYAFAFRDSTAMVVPASIITLPGLEIEPI